MPLHERGEGARARALRRRASSGAHVQRPALGAGGSRSLRLAPRSISMAKTPQTKGGYTRVDGLDVEDESFEGDSVASIQAHWRK